MSMDETVSVELSNVRRVKQMPISRDCIAKKGDLRNWPHLHDIEFQELEVGEVMLVVGLKDKPSLFLPLEYKTGGEDEPVAVRYSLGWTVIGPVGSQKDSPNCSVNFDRSVDSPVLHDSVLDVQGEDLCVRSVSECVRSFGQSDDKVASRRIPTQEEFTPEMNGKVKEADSMLCCDKEVESQARDEELHWQLERLWKTDFENSEVETKVCLLIEDRRALEIMERTLKRVDGHFQVALPW